MTAILIKPKDRSQAAAIKKILKALDIPFERSEPSYNPDFVEKIQQAEEEIEKGKVTRISKESQKAFLGL